MLIPDFYEILDIEDDSMPHAPVDTDIDPNVSGKVSTHSRDSGRNSSRASSRGVMFFSVVNFLNGNSDVEI